MSPADLRAARNDLGLTQRELAKALFMGEYGWQMISAYENGRKPMPADMGLKMAGLRALRKGK